jgi:hypothetical protein
MSSVRFGFSNCGLRIHFESAIRNRQSEISITLVSLLVVIQEIFTRPVSTWCRFARPRCAAGDHKRVLLDQDATP